MFTLYNDFGFDLKVKLSLDASAAKGIIERQGICKIRHLDVDTLWLQEQQARRLLPIHKVQGTENPADLMTKGLSEKVVHKYLKLMAMDWVSGRAAAAAQLHYFNVAGRAYRSGDSWDGIGARGVLRRCHATWRRALFSPMKVRGGPKSGKELLSRRVTTGKKQDGTKFTIEDDWKVRTNAHRVLPFAWVGHTAFFYVKGGGKRDLDAVRHVDDADPRHKLSKLPPHLRQNIDPTCPRPAQCEPAGGTQVGIRGCVAADGCSSFSGDTVDSFAGGRNSGNQVSEAMNIRKMDGKLEEQRVEQINDDDDGGNVNVIASHAGHWKRCLMTSEPRWADVFDTDDRALVACEDSV